MKMFARFPKILFAASFFLFVLSLNSNAWSAGFAIYTQGASALGQGNAVTAHLDDPSAIFYNPALLSFLDGTQILVGTTLIHSKREFASDQQGLDFDHSTTHFPSTFYLSHKLTPTLTAGLGIFSPFGLGTEWSDTWEGRYITTNSDLTTFNFNPVLCWQVRPGFSVAGGIDYLLLDADLEKNIRLAPLPDGKQKFSGDGDGLGFNLGLAVDLGYHLSFGLHYRSEIQVDVDGDANFSLPAGTPASILSLLQDTQGTTSVTLPQQAQAGLAYSGFPNVVIEVGGRWEDWSSFDKLEINLDTGLTQTTLRNWRDSYAFNVGGKYEVNKSWALSAGYVFDKNPAPDSTFDPSIPTADSHIFSLGSEVAWQSWRLAVAYAYQHFEAREKNNDVGLAEGGTANGTYRTVNHMLGLSLLYRFNAF